MGKVELTLGLFSGRPLMAPVCRMTLEPQTGALLPLSSFPRNMILSNMSFKKISKTSNTQQTKSNDESPPENPLFGIWHEDASNKGNWNTESKSKIEDPDYV